MSQVSDYNIANASGASVRSDLNAVFDAIKTLNSGSNDPANPLAFMPYVDTSDSNNLKIRNAANDDFVTVGSINEDNLGLLLRSGGIMTGQLLADDSSGAGSPALSFDGDTDTGIFRVGANTMGFATAGVKRVEISDSGLDMTNGLPIRFQDSSGAPFVALKSPSSVSANRTFTLPATTGTAGQFLSVSSSNHSATNAELVFSTVQGVPSGSVFCMAVATIPSGYLECNGAAVSRVTYAVLFGVIGTQYGTGDGSSTFNLPDLRGEFVRGFDNGRGADSGRSIGSSQGDDNKQHNHGIDFNTQSHTLTGNIQKISETFNNSGSASGVFSKQTGFGANFTPGSPDVNDTGAVNFNGTHSHHVIGSTENQGSESRPRNIAMMYIIKT